MEVSLQPICKITTSGVSSLIIGCTYVSIYLIVTPMNLMLHFLKIKFFASNSLRHAGIRIGLPLPPTVLCEL